MGDEYQYLQPIAPQPQEDALVEPKALTPSQNEAIGWEREKFFRLVPEFYAFFREAHEMGMHDGWRSVRVTPINDKPNDDEQQPL